MLRTALAVTAGKLSAELIKTFKIGSGTSLPGKIALRVDPALLETLARQVRQKTAVITGTNGKSTTAGLLSAWIEASGHMVVHNQLGANMVPGITAALLQKSTFGGRLSADFGVLEADEASLPKMAHAIRQDVTLVTNLFRDQLDRYGELDTTARLIQRGILESGGQLLLNADDPIVASIGLHFDPQHVYYYGMDKVETPSMLVDFPVGFPKEVTDCPVCRQPLTYTQFFTGHLGHYACPACGFHRPKPWLLASPVQVRETGSHMVLIRQGHLSQSITLPLPGLFNAYNGLAAIALGYRLGLSPETLQPTLNQFHGIFGRAETQVIEGKTVRILLIKNPMGATEVLNVVRADPNARVLVIINDNYADGRDISWLWDAPFEGLAGQTQPIWVSGHRMADMAIRLKYAGIVASQIIQEPHLEQAFFKAVQQTELHQTLYVLPTYTALLQLSQRLGSR